MDITLGIRSDRFSFSKHLFIMSNPSPAQVPEESQIENPTPETTQDQIENSTPETTAEPQPSYVKLAMRNMVRKGGTSLKHFFLTTIALVGLLVGLAYLTR